MFLTVNSASFSLMYYFFYHWQGFCDETQRFEAVGKLEKHGQPVPAEKHGQPVPAATALSCSSERPLSERCWFQQQGKGQALLTNYYFIHNSFICLGRQRHATTASKVAGTTNLDLAPATVKEPCKKHLYKYMYFSRTAVNCSTWWLKLQW